ncbi:hypothetical protein [Caudoviricetes sp.]|nr:hypothetical protein [Caudoviricetes sp.]
MRNFSIFQSNKGHIAVAVVKGIYKPKAVCIYNGLEKLQPKLFRELLLRLECDKTIPLVYMGNVLKLNKSLNLDDDLAILRGEKEIPDIEWEEVYSHMGEVLSGNAIHISKDIPYHLFNDKMKSFFPEYEGYFW